MRVVWYRAVMFDRILIANRGEIACRIIRSARAMGIGTVAVYSDADARAPHVRMADSARRIGPAAAAESYLSMAAILEAVRESGAQAVHPGYGFLSENADFARRLAAEGITFIGPPPAAIAAMGDKIESKRIAAQAGLRVVPGGAGAVESVDDALRVAEETGFPVMLKASAGGGGKGMRIARDARDLREGFVPAQSEAQAAFGDGRLFIEKYIENPRHIEIQVLADTHGNCIHLGERECSIQRRNQKVVEESPSPLVDAGMRAAMGAQAVALAQAVGYVSAGTVEFIVDGTGNFHFLEMNTRLQVEHPVTELVTGVDLVAAMIRIAAGERLWLRQEDMSARGWAMESRIYAEDPLRGFLPSAGRLVRYRPPEGVRLDDGVEEGSRIGTDYDPMIGKLCTHGATRAEVIARMQAALDTFEIEGVGNNLGFLSALMAHPRLVAGDLSTGFIAEEWPDGFVPVVPDEEGLRAIAAAAAVMAQVRGGPGGRVVTLAGRDWPVRAVSGGVEVAGRLMQVESDWRPGQALARILVDGVPLVLQVAPIAQGFRIRHRGADLVVLVRRPRAVELAAHLPVKAAADLSRLLAAPMPGQVVRVAVEVGETVEEGQPLIVIEAMKMENLLRSPRAGTIRRLHAAPGQGVRADEVILEFE